MTDNANMQGNYPHLLLHLFSYFSRVWYAFNAKFSFLCPHTACIIGLCCLSVNFKVLPFSNLYVNSKQVQLYSPVKSISWMESCFVFFWYFPISLIQQTIIMNWLLIRSRSYKIGMSYQASDRNKCFFLFQGLTIVTSFYQPPQPSVNMRLFTPHGNQTLVRS